MTIRRLLFPAALLSFAVMAPGCGGNEETNDGGADGAVSGADGDGQVAEEPRELVIQARATIEPLGDSGVSGTITFAPTDLGMQVSYVLDGLAAGDYGFHVHENGSCADGEDDSPGGAAGGHFNPDGAPHGAPNLPAGQRHVGDFGNLHSLSEGMAIGSFNASIATFEGPNSIVGKALIIHVAADDFITQPSGDSGSRIGCGVIHPAEAS